MKALTVWQPWAQLLAKGYKHIETRSWKTNYRGEILIHAAQKSFHECWFRYVDDDVKTLISRYMELPETFNCEKYFPRGCIVGKANLVECRRMDDIWIHKLKNYLPEEYAFGDYKAGRYAWILENQASFETPIVTSGRQGLWNYDGVIDGRWQQ